MPPAPAPTPTMGDLLDYYAAEVLPGKSTGTQENYRSTLRHCRQAWGALPVTALTPATIRQWRDALSATLAPGTVRNHLDILSALLTIGVNELEWFAIHPMRKVRKPPASPGRTRCLTPGERIRLLAACQQSRNPALFPIVVMALHTGCRKNEIRGLTWDHVDLEQGVLRLTKTKNGRPRIVPLVGQALALLRAWQGRAQPQGPPGWVFPGPYGRGPREIDNAWKKACTRAQLEDFRFHDLRHSAASYLAMSGASLLEIADILGHRTMQMVQRYSHFTLAHTTGVMEKMATTFLETQETA